MPAPLSGTIPVGLVVAADLRSAVAVTGPAATIARLTSSPIAAAALLSGDVIRALPPPGIRQRAAAVCRPMLGAYQLVSGRPPPCRVTHSSVTSTALACFTDRADAEPAMVIVSGISCQLVPLTR